MGKRSKAKGSKSEKCRALGSRAGAGHRRGERTRAQGLARVKGQGLGGYPAPCSSLRWREGVSPTFSYF